MTFGDVYKGNLSKTEGLKEKIVAIKTLRVSFNCTLGSDSGLIRYGCVSDCMFCANY